MGPHYGDTPCRQRPIEATTLQPPFKRGLQKTDDPLLPLSASSRDVPHML